MRQKSKLCLLLFVTLVTFALSGNAQSLTLDQPDYDAIAHQIVNNALELIPGEVVIIMGNPAELDLLSALVVAVAKAGGQPSVQLDLPEANKRVLMETPIEYLKMTPTYPLMLVRAADCIIGTGSIQDPKLFADVPEERMAASRQASMPIANALNRAHYRSVNLGQAGGIPTLAYAESRGANYEEMLAMFWKSLNVDYKQMLGMGQTISNALKPNSVVNMSTEAGTNLTFKISDIPSRTNCGRCAENITASGPASVWLPAGEAYACVDPTSASGTVVVPSIAFRGSTVKNLKLTFENGRITDLTADENGDLISENLKMSTGDKDVLSIIDIGLNPNSQSLQGSDYYSYEMAGMVTIFIGNNAWAGGNVVSDFGLGLHLANSTLNVDGKTIVSKGQLEIKESMAVK
jgi:aminopeptidase